MIYLDLILNLALLVALSVVSGFIDKRWQRNARLGILLQGVLFGCVAVIGMLRPMVLGPGLIFDGRSVMISLCALFFGPWAVSVACLITIACRVTLGGVGTFMGVSVILSSAVIGLAAYYRLKPSVQPPSMLRLYGLGLAVHLVMVALMFTLPEGMGLATFKRLGLPVVLLYPLATILAGKILADQLSNIQTIEALRESEERYRLLFDASHDAILLTSPDGRILNANPAARRLFGRTEQELTELERNEVVVVTDPRLFSALEERDRTEKFNGELTLVRKDGSKFEAEISSSVFLNREGNARTGMFIRDITERKQIEKALHESEDLFKNIFHRHTAIKLLVDSENGQIIDANDAAANYYGWTREHLMGMKIQDINTLPAEDVKEALKRVEKMERVCLEFQHRRADGSIRDVEVFSGKIEVKGKVLLHSIINDITDKKRAEEAILKLNEDLEQKIDERTAELKKTIAQLEELNRVFVDRELKMAELKERIAELEKNEQ